MKDKTLVFSLLSLLIPLVTYLFFFLAGLAPARLSEPGVYAPMFVSNASGITLSILTFRKTNPTDVSRSVLVSVLLSSIAIFANIVAVEIVLYTSVIRTAKL